MKIALIGNPNSGKTSLFNALTGARQKVGNWPGVTIDKKMGEFTYQHEKTAVIDLPGVYDLELSNTQGSLDEKVARDYLSDGDADCILNVVDASNLERNLYLTLQLLELKKPMVIALNMMDIADRHGLKIDLAALQIKLGVPIVPIIARKRKGLGLLKEKIFALKNQTLPASPLLTKLAETKKNLAQEYHETEDLIVADARYRTLTAMLSETTQHIKTKRKRFTGLLDKVVLNRFLGIPIFLLVMYLMFEFSITIGGAVQPLFDEGSKAIFIDGVSYLGYLLHIPTWITAIFADGIGLGINSVLTFIPQIGGLFFFYRLLKTLAT